MTFLIEADHDPKFTRPPIIREREVLGIPPLQIVDSTPHNIANVEQQPREYKMTYGENLCPETPEPISILGLSELPSHLGGDIIVPIQFFITGTTQEQIDGWTNKNSDKNNNIDQDDADDQQDILSRTIFFRVSNGVNGREWDAIYEVSPKDMTHLEQITTSPDGNTYVTRSRPIGPGTTKTVTIDVINPNKSVKSIETDFAPHGTASVISPDGGLFIVGNHSVDDPEVKDWKLSHISPKGDIKEIKRIAQSGQPANVFGYDSERLIVTSKDKVTIVPFKGNGKVISGFFSKAEESVYITDHKYMVRMQSGGDGIMVDVVKIGLDAIPIREYAKSIMLPPHSSRLLGVRVDATHGNHAFARNTLSIPVVFEDLTPPGFPSLEPQTRHLAIRFEKDGSFEVVDTSSQPEWLGFMMSVGGSYATDGNELRRFDLNEIAPTATPTPTNSPEPSPTSTPSRTPTPDMVRRQIFLPALRRMDQRAPSNRSGSRHNMRFNSQPR